MRLIANWYQAGRLDGKVALFTGALVVMSDGTRSKLDYRSMAITM
jgi:hypothetical protein